MESLNPFENQVYFHAEQMDAVKQEKRQKS